jgi:hypothetical protein
MKANQTAGTARPGVRYLGNVLVFFVSLVVALGLCEAGARLVLNSSDYLSVETKKDSVLGITIPAGSAGFDSWGFRNPSVLSRVNVLAVGDSHTFGNTARMEDSWPSVLAASTGLSTYNMGLGGYGPVQYFHLLSTKGMNLHPEWVLCGLYMGDDFENAFSMTYGLDHWAYLRSGQFTNVDPNIWGNAEPLPWHKDLRNWLSRNSLVYRLTVHGPLLGKARENVQFSRAARGEDPATTVLTLPDKNIKEAFRPAAIAARLDQDSAPVQEGMRITFRLLRDMDAVCQKQGCRFAVVVIPTKESVFSTYFHDNSTIPLKGALDKVLSNEQAARTKLFAELDRAGIPYVDTLPALQAAAGGELYARTTNDMHPGKNGYRVIGEVAAAFLKHLQQRQ